MSDQINDQRKINPPEVHRKADIGRAAARAVAGAIPVVGSVAAELTNEILPDPTTKLAIFNKMGLAKTLAQDERIDDAITWIAQRRGRGVDRIRRRALIL